MGAEVVGSIPCAYCFCPCLYFHVWLALLNFVYQSVLLGFSEPFYISVLRRRRVRQRNHMLPSIRLQSGWPNSMMHTTTCSMLVWPLSAPSPLWPVYTIGRRWPWLISLLLLHLGNQTGSCLFGVGFCHYCFQARASLCKSHLVTRHTLGLLLPLLVTLSLWTPSQTIRNWRSRLSPRGYWALPRFVTLCCMIGFMTPPGGPARFVCLTPFLTQLHLFGLNRSVWWFSLSSVILCRWHYGFIFDQYLGWLLSVGLLKLIALFIRVISEFCFVCSRWGFVLETFCQVGLQALWLKSDYYYYYYYCRKSHLR